MCIINAVCFGGLTFLFLDSILLFFGASHDTLPYARDFMQVILLGTPITYVFIGLNNVMRATGYPRKAMFSSLLTVGCNIIFGSDIYIFIRLGEYGVQRWQQSCLRLSLWCGCSFILRTKKTLFILTVGTPG